MTGGRAGSDPASLEALLRDLAPQVLGSLLRQQADFAACEDAVQEALLAAAGQWPVEGVPRNPKGWLSAVARRRLIEAVRNEGARRRREERAARLEPSSPPAPVAEDDTLTLLFLCCHPSLTAASQVALTLRAVGGLTTAEIARAFFVSESTIGQRISRAKERIRQSGGRFLMPPPEEHSRRLGAVLHVLYLVFTEGHTASSGSDLVRLDLSKQAIRLARQLHSRLPDEGEVAGLLALMLLTDARRSARTDTHGNLIPLREQDRRLWDREEIAEGVAIVTEALSKRPPGPYQLQAAIAAVHADAATSAETDWRKILTLYDLLLSVSPGPMVALNRIVAVSMVDGAETGLRELEKAVANDPVLADHYRAEAVRAHLLEAAGEPLEAIAAYRRAARRTLNLPEQRYLDTRASRLTSR